ncbi:hypothetical protein Nepgr_005452 [Nepenthes gracilis]|uniref:Serine-rich protein-like protein n=1 Tax=Nepenthes gracilis TaxID=150966 RepID=A0AAD3XGG8_NEPGR|nr:hypothetical protein Nepgr_005452 [Nepenthes gracilis]
MAATTSRTKSNGFQRSASPSGRFCSSSISSTSSTFASSCTSLSSRCSGLFERSSSPTRLNLYGTAPNTSSSMRLSIDRLKSPGRSIAVNQIVKKQSSLNKKKTCMCSPTTHPGSFRCSLHKNIDRRSAVLYQPNRLDMRRSAMKNSLVRIGTMEGEWVKRALATLIRPSSHQQRRRVDFQPRPSRLSIMSKAENL